MAGKRSSWEEKTALDMALGVTRRDIGAAPSGRDRGLLIEMGGQNAGRVHRMEGEVTIGRGLGCTVNFQDATLSREHARVVREGEDWVLTDAGSLNGTFVNDDKVSRQVLRHGDRVRLASGLRLQFMRATPEEETVLVQLYEASVRDGLTGSFNRRHLEEALATEASYAARHRTDLSLLMMDLDHFKLVNDTYGHLAGDEVLRQTASVLAGQLRREDLLARYGGEEFAVVVRGIPVEHAMRLGERVRGMIERAVVFFEGTELRVTVSIGVAALATLDGEVTATRLISAADDALYRAKELGRNRVIQWQPVPL